MLSFSVIDTKRVKFYLDPSNWPKADWAAVDAMTEEEREAAAVAAPDASPASEEQLARMRRVPDVGAIRHGMGLSVEQFAARFGLSPVLVREWEERRRVLDPAAKVLLRVIEREPDAVARAAAE